jgi:hypothetical protein
MRITFLGAPGCGKTTTILSLISKFAALDMPLYYWPDAGRISGNKGYSVQEYGGTLYATITNMMLSQSFNTSLNDETIVLIDGGPILNGLYTKLRLQTSNPNNIIPWDTCLQFEHAIDCHCYDGLFVYLESDFTTSRIMDGIRDKDLESSTFVHIVSLLDDLIEILRKKGCHVMHIQQPPTEDNIQQLFYRILPFLNRIDSIGGHCSE